MSVSFKGFNEKVLTFKTSSDIEAGCPVKISDNGTVAACSSGEAFCGVTVHSQGGYASVQLAGTVTLPYAGSTAPAVGYDTLTAAADGKVTVSADGREYLVLSVDTAASEVTFVI